MRPESELSQFSPNLIASAHNPSTTETKARYFVFRHIMKGLTYDYFKQN